MIRNSLVGFIVTNFIQKDTCYLDDIQILSGNDIVMKRFEKQS